MRAATSAPGCRCVGRARPRALGLLGAVCDERRPRRRRDGVAALAGRDAPELRGGAVRLGRGAARSPDSVSSAPPEEILYRFVAASSLKEMGARRPTDSERPEPEAATAIRESRADAMR